VGREVGMGLISTSWTYREIPDGRKEEAGLQGDGIDVYVIKFHVSIVSSRADHYSRIIFT